jgi:CheY-like chemotaxis protein
MFQKGLKLLVVEDNLLNQKLIFLHLKRHGFVIDFAENGKIALKKIDQNSYDLVLMDLMMPIMDGLETSVKIREKERFTGDHLKIIGLTANTMDADREKCIEHGMDEYMAKPFDLDEFHKILKKLDLA